MDQLDGTVLRDTIPPRRLPPLVAVAVLCPFRAHAYLEINTRVHFQTMRGFGTSERVFDHPDVFQNFKLATSRAPTVLTQEQQDEQLYCAGGVSSGCGPRPRWASSPKTTTTIPGSTYPHED